jgi:hypothetical protein
LMDYFPQTFNCQIYFYNSMRPKIYEPVCCPRVVVKINYRKNEKMSSIVSAGGIKKHL